MMNNRSLSKRVAFGASLVAALVAGPLFMSLVQARDTAPAPSPPITVLPHPAFAYAAPNAPAATASLADVAEHAVKSVVNISSTQLVSQTDPFFGRSQQTRMGAGSGVIVSREGVILTNNHVVAHAKKIKVTLSDGRAFAADVVGTDPKSDLAVIKLDKPVKGLEPLRFADSDRIRLGDIVLAIGNPFGVGQTVTMGIVSAKGRANMGIVDYEDFIQTDAAINPGNSGGALVNMDGDLVGINTAILSRTGGSQGIGFAIPARMVQPIMASLLRDGEVRRGFLGVTIQDVDGDIASAMGVAPHAGVLVSDVVDASPAAKAGLRRGDLITRIDGTATTNVSRLRNIVANAGVGARLPVELVRDGKTLTVPVLLEALPDQVANRSPARGRTHGVEGPSGLHLAPLDRTLRAELDIPRELRSGVVVTDVDADSDGAAIGLRPGDVIVEVNRKRVSSPKELTAALERSRRRTLLLVYRDGSMLYLAFSR